MSGFSESSTVQAWILDRLSRHDIGWTHVRGDDLTRPVDSVLVEEDVRDALVRLNPVIAEDPERVNEVLPGIRAALLSVANDGLLAANETMTTWLRGHHTHEFIGRKGYEPVRLVDFDDPGNNTLVVSDEVSFGVPGAKQRFDVVLWVNGIPLVVGEAKTPVDHKKSWLDGAFDVTDGYEVDSAPFFVANVLSFATEGREFHYGAIGQAATDWLMWGSTDDPADLEGAERVMRSVELLLRPERVLSILRDFTLFDRTQRSGSEQRIKLIPRYPQVEGVEAIHARVLDPERRRGLIWHYQGTGKTLLMAYAALRLLNDDRVGGPTVLIVLDRLDLIEQTHRQFATAGLPRLRVAGTKDQLRQMLADDHRGIIVTTIFRFEGAGELNDRDNIIVLVDEAHRTQEGRLGHDMRTAIPNAQFFGLTGTPIADSDRNTFKLFGDEDDPGWVMNQYTMGRSITDGSSVPVHVETRLVDFHVDRESLDEAFEAMADEEGLDEDERERLATRATSVKTLMANPERIEAVCSDIVDHYVAKVAPLGMKAQVVAFDRELCVRYHETISRILVERGLVNDHTADVVMTIGSTKTEPKEWRRFELTREAEAEVKRRFCDPHDPLSFLIVTAKLLTGFDAPIEGVMYLDKPLRLHTLFQAITRTNRRWTNPSTGQEKHYGLIVDYVGIGNQIGRALQDADPDSGGKRPVETDELLGEFTDRLDGLLARFGDLDRGDASFEGLIAAQKKIPAGDPRDDFAREFQRLEMLWEFLDPHPELFEFRDDYRWLAKVYESVKPAEVSDALLWARLGAKTLNLVHEHISDVEVQATGLDEVIVDAEVLEAIRQLALDMPSESGESEPITVGEALDTIDARLRRRFEASGGHAVYRKLSERLENLRRHQLDKATASVEFLRELLELAREVTVAERADDAGELDAGILPDPNVGALTQILSEYRPDDTPEAIDTVVTDIDAVVKRVQFSGWTQTHAGDRTVRQELHKLLKKHGLQGVEGLFDRVYAYVRENY